MFFQAASSTELKNLMAFSAVVVEASKAPTFSLAIAELLRRPEIPSSVSPMYTWVSISSWCFMRMASCFILSIGRPAFMAFSRSKIV